MSEPHPIDEQGHGDDADGPHEGPIRTPKQLIATIAASFLIPIFAIVLLVNYVAFGERPAAGSDGMTKEAIARRLQPVGMVEVRDLADPASMRTGQQVYQAQCGACHAIGAAGAPKTGDAAAWAPRLAQGYETLLASVLKGKGAMGAQGGGDFSDFEIARAVVFQVNQSGGKLAEPALPAAAASAAAASAPN